MVGVAGKSKACHTCRKRRVKCDLQRPACSTCLRSGRDCSGYDRSLIYVNRTADSPSITAVDVLRDSRKKAPHPVDTAADQETPAAELQKLFLGDLQSRFRAYATDLLREYYLPRGLSNVDLISEQDQGTFSWVYSLTSLVGPSLALDTSLYALCLTQIHLTGNGDVTLAKCMDWYNESLQRLRQDLTDPHTRMTDETLAAVIVLSTIELFLSQGDDGWRAHARGITDILRMRGGAPHGQTPVWMHLLSRLRVICTIEALAKRQAQILDESLWRLNEIQVGPVGTVVELYYLVSDLPVVFEDADRLGSEDNFEHLLNGASSVLRRLFGHIRQIDDWFDSWRARSPGPLHWSVPSVVTSPADPSPSQKLFPFAIEFPSISVMACVSQVWTLKTIIYSDIIQLYDHVVRQCSHLLTLGAILHRSVNSRQEAATTLASLRDGNAEQPHMDTITIEDVRREGTQMARLVCQSMEYAHRVEMGTLGVQCTTFPRWAVRHYFRFHAGHERELQWANEIHKISGVGTRWDYDMMVLTPLQGPIGSR